MEREINIVNLRNDKGMFFQSDATGEVKQLTGTCQFASCKTYSGMRRKLLNWYNDCF